MDDGGGDAAVPVVVVVVVDVVVDGGGVIYLMFDVLYAFDVSLLSLYLYCHVTNTSYHPYQKHMLHMLVTLDTSSYMLINSCL